ncbi:Guanine nucleotide-binding protein subunit gamma 3 [Citrus sinensis]|nr:Guanine nucleotide-binding protein subunit gamma 3 [Citrus sinensis]
MDNACRSSLVESPMGPRSPPAAALDLYGKRRQMVKVQVLEREIGLLQEELKSVEDVQPASICCKEYVWLLCCIVVDDFVGAKPDPLVAMSLVKNGANAWDFHACTMHAAVSSLGTIVQR